VNESSLHGDRLVVQAGIEADGMPILDAGRLVV
jgi:hypothetical protein